MENKLRYGIYAINGVVLYLFFAALLYNAGYWSQFDVNIVSLSNFWDLFKFPLSNIAQISFFIALIVLFLVSFSVWRVGNKKEKIVDIEKKPKKVSKGFKVFLSIFISFYFIFYAVYILSSDESPTNWVCFYMVLAIPPSLFLIEKFFPQFFSTNHTLKLLLFFVGAYPLLMLDSGRMDAEKILENKSFQTVSFGSSKNNALNENYKYLGTMGGDIFVMTLDNKSVIVTKIGEDRYLKINR